MALVCLLATSSAAQMRPLPDPQPFLQEVKKRLQPDEERQSGYMYVQTQRNQKLDKAGRSTSESVTVAESYPGLPGEGRWSREISRDGQPVPARVCGLASGRGVSVNAIVSCPSIVSRPIIRTSNTR